MKKGLTILVLLAYSLSVFGIGLKEIYCCGKLKTVSVAVTHHEKHECSKDSKHGCCKTKYHYLKTQGNHLATTSTSTPVKPEIEIHSLPSLYQQPCYGFKRNAIVNGSHASPLHGVPIYIYNCVYRI